MVDAFADGFAGFAVNVDLAVGDATKTGLGLSVRNDDAKKLAGVVEGPFARLSSRLAAKDGAVGKRRASTMVGLGTLA